MNSLIPKTNDVSDFVFQIIDAAGFSLGAGSRLVTLISELSTFQGKAGFSVVTLVDS